MSNKEIKEQVQATTEAMVTNHIQLAVNAMFNKFYQDYKLEWEAYDPQKKIEILDKQLKQIREQLIQEIQEDHGNNI